MNSQKYLEHVAGMASFMEWVFFHQKIGHEITQTEHQVVLDMNIATKFIIGVPNSRKWGQYPFIAAQKREAIFLKLMNITRIAVHKGKPYIHFVVPSVKGDGIEYPDIPAFYITLTLDFQEKIQVLTGANKLDLRGFWFDEGKIEIGTRHILWNLPVEKLEPGAPVLQEKDHSDGPSFKELIQMRIQNTNVYNNPGYR